MIVWIGCSVWFDVLKLRDWGGNRVKIPLAAADGSAPLRTHLVQIVVLANHQNGRDTHLRIAKIFAPTSSTTSLIAPFTTDECAAYGSVR